MPLPKNLFVDSYDVVRLPLKCIFLFGCYTAKQVRNTMGIDESTYKENIQRLMAVLAREYVSENKSKFNRKSKVISIDYNRYDNIANLLISSLKLKSVTTKQLFLDLNILQLLAIKEDDPLTIQDISSYFEGLPSWQLYSRINCLKNIGLINSEPTGYNKECLYTLADNIFEEMPAALAKELHMLLYMYRHLLPMSSLGHMLQESLQKISMQDKRDIFIFKDCYYWKMLDDEVLIHIYIAKEQSRKILFDYTYTEKGFVNKKKVQGFPYKIMQNKYDNRQYLFLDEDNTLRIYRLDYISNIVILDIQGTSAKYDIEPCYSGYIPYTGENPFYKHEVIIDFYLPNEWMIKKLNEKKGNGIISKITDNHYVYRIEVYDPIGMIPWIRTFRQYAVVRKSSTHKLRERIEYSYKEILKNYDQ